MLAKDTRFVYDGWNIAAEVNGTNNTVIRNFVWGLDLSGTFQGAGGVGGLLAVHEYVTTPGSYYYCYDGNGNVTGIANATTGGLAAHYDYGPFGESLKADNAYGKTNPFRFSTKYTDNDSGLLYYGYRHYSPSVGRWINRDPIGEEGSLELINSSPWRRKIRWDSVSGLYCFVSNGIPNSVDILGLEGFDSMFAAADAAGSNAIEVEHEKALKSYEKMKKNGGAGAIYQPLEHGGRVCCKDDKFTTTTTGPAERGAAWPHMAPACPSGWVLVAFWHSHPGDINSNNGTFRDGGDFSGESGKGKGNVGFVEDDIAKNRDQVPLTMTHKTSDGYETKALYPNLSQEIYEP